MDIIDLSSILEKYNKQLFESLKNEMMKSFKEDLLKDFKNEIYNLFINDKKDNINTCGFKRTRHRGYCKRHIKGFVCPYHLKQFKNNCNKLIPDEKPDKILCGTYISTTKNEEYVNMEKINLYKKDLLNIKIYDYNKKYLPILKYNLKRDIKDIEAYYIEIDLLNNIDITQSNNCIINSIYDKNKKSKVAEIEKIDKYIKVSFIKDTKGNSYVKNPFPDNFLIDERFSCKCYTMVYVNNMEKIKIYLVNPKDKTDSKIKIINIVEMEHLMLEIYTEKTVNTYFNK